MKNSRNRTKVVLSLGLLCLLACGQPGPSESTAVADDAGAEQVEREAAEREMKQAVARVRDRLDTLREEVARLHREAKPVLSSLDASVRSSLEDLDTLTDKAQQEVTRLVEAGVEGWKSLESEVDAELDNLRERIDGISETLEGQKSVLERRNEERKPLTGLFEGLDGGDYEAYRVEVVREVQRSLRQRQYYPGPVDGYLGRPTMEALARFQSDHGLVANGVPTPETRKRLFDDA